MRPAAILDGLNPEQRRSAEAMRGPVRVLAGAGTGKTTTITRRIAHQVASGVFEAGQILAVTFTDKAAGEMRARLAHLGVEGVRARTFHSAAAAQLHHLAPEPPGRILPSKIIALRQLASGLPKPYRYRPAGDLATEIEWARNRRIGLEGYEDALGEHIPPIPADLMLRVWRRYEEGKRRRGLIDFEDLLELAIRMFDDDAYALETFQARYLAFTVDEYQDANLLQQSLLERWLGDRDDLCVVGDDYQSIYGFTGATPRYLLDMPARMPRTVTVRLEQSYRSTPQVLGVANALAATLGGARKVLEATRGAGPAPVLRQCATFEDELRFVVAHIRRLHEDGVSFEDMAVLYRVNFRSEDYEEVLTEDGVPFQVRDGGFLQRQAARRMLSLLKRSEGSADVAERVRAAALSDGWLETMPEGLGEREVTRQRDLARLVRLAAEHDGEGATVGDFAAALRARFAPEGRGAGVNLLTYHRAKGLEFEAVFLPRLQEGELPYRRSSEGDALAEERRLFYVGVTRARTHLVVTWNAEAKPSRFLEPVASPAGRRRRESLGAAGPAVGALKAWRRERARRDGVPAYVVMHDSTLEAIARRRPADEVELSSVAGIGPTKLERYGTEILAALARAADRPPEMAEGPGARSPEAG